MLQGDWIHGHSREWNDITWMLNMLWLCALSFSITYRSLLSLLSRQLNQIGSNARMIHPSDIHSRPNGNKIYWGNWLSELSPGNAMPKNVKSYFRNWQKNKTKTQARPIAAACIEFPANLPWILGSMDLETSGNIFNHWMIKNACQETQRSLGEVWKIQQPQSHLMSSTSFDLKSMCIEQLQSILAYGKGLQLN